MPNSPTLNTLRDATASSAHADFIRHNARNDRTFGATLAAMLTACALLPFAATHQPATTPTDIAAAATNATAAARQVPTYALETVVIRRTPVVAKRAPAAADLTTQLAAGPY